jgi:hypothetical protein
MFKPETKITAATANAVAANVTPTCVLEGTTRDYIKRGVDL